MDTPLKVRRKRRGRCLSNKIFEYGELFDIDITIIAQERASGDYEVFQPRPEILHTGRPIAPKCGRRKVPKPPRI
ncbi:hypothetical protein BN1723_009122 [Verticillium longisporum]|uniref:Uncharacterized protein n=1 Tax=Verticillium longisporum TaxID=100787 RepID=A0A0G4KLU4_VERLO|nr:hypothetical protein BN1723_009122 [Verticillium longisporum]